MRESELTEYSQDLRKKITFDPRDNVVAVTPKDFFYLTTALIYTFQVFPIRIIPSMA